MASSWGWPRPLNWKCTTFTITRLEPFMTEILPVSKLLSNDTLYGFLLRYINRSYFNWLRNCELLNLEVQKKCLNHDDLCSKMLFFQALFLDFQIQQLVILKPVEVEKTYIPQKKALLPIVWKKFETGWIFVMKGSRRVLVDKVLFQSTSTKTYLEPSMAKIHPVSKLLSNNG